MNGEKILIFDLDDTIFETRSIGTHHLKEVFNQFRVLAAEYYSSGTLKKIEEELWHYPFDQVASTYEFPEALSKLFSRLITETEFRFNIQPFIDFEHVRNLDLRKKLVTSGFRHLQEAKITALGIASVFEEVIIDAIDAQDRIFKLGIFKKILSESGLRNQDHIVIGDNPHSELKAGNELGFTTVQVGKLGQPCSQYSDYYITDFRQLHSLINDAETKSF